MDKADGLKTVQGLVPQSGHANLVRLSIHVGRGLAGELSSPPERLGAKWWPVRSGSGASPSSGDSRSWPSPQNHEGHSLIPGNGPWSLGRRGPLQRCSTHHPNEALSSFLGGGFMILYFMICLSSTFTNPLTNRH